MVMQVMIIVYLVSNRVIVVYNKRIITKDLFKIVDKGLIKDKEKFSEEFMRLLKDNKIKNKLLGEDIWVLKNTYYTEGELFFIQSIFERLGYLKVRFIDIKDFFKEKNSIYIEINNDYLVINMDRGILVDLEFFKDIKSILKMIESDKPIILFGDNEKLHDIIEEKSEIYYIDNTKNYIADALLDYKFYKAN